MAHKIHLTKTRDALAPRGEPYWGTPLAGGVYLGYRKHKNGIGTWVARWRDDGERQRYETLGRASARFDHDAAQKAAQAWHKRIEAGVGDSEVETVEDACRAYVADVRAKGRKRTARDAECRFERRVYGTPFGAIKLAKLCTAHIEDWHATNRKPLRGGAEQLTAASRNRLLTSVKAALNSAARRKDVDPARASEWKNVKPEEETGRRELYLDLPQRRRLLAELSGGIRDFAEAVMLTGARAGEIAGARRSQFDARAQAMTFIGKTGTRKVLVSKEACALFARLSQSKLPNAPLFTRDDGLPWIRSGDWAALINEAVERAKLPAGACLYTLRHCWITDAITGGMDLLTVSKLVGTSISMIDNYYGHLADTIARDHLAAITFA